jgi:hypothetical protein
MPDKRKHRGANPADAKLFGEKNIPQIRQAVEDFSLLLTKGYSDKSSLKLVCDRFSLTERQRLAVMRSSCSNRQLELRKSKQLDITDIAGQPVAIDGYNCLITIEAAMSGGILFAGRDGCYRDLASLHGTYRKVDETIPAVTLINEFLKDAGAGNILWLLDKPVSNSGRLKSLIGQLSIKNGWNCRVELSISPDHLLINTDDIVASSDSVILDGCKRWINLARTIIEKKLPESRAIELFQ